MASLSTRGVQSDHKFCLPQGNEICIAMVKAAWMSHFAKILLGKPGFTDMN